MIIRSSKSCFSKLSATCLDQTVRLHIRVDIKGLWKNSVIYNYIAVLEPILKCCEILKSVGWGTQLLIGKCRFHFPFSVYLCDSCRKGILELWIFTIFKAEKTVKFKAGFPWCSCIVSLESEYSEFRVTNRQSFSLSSWSVTELSVRFLSCSVSPTAAVSVLISSHILASFYYVRLLNFLSSGRCVVEPAQKLKGSLMWKQSSHSAHKPPYSIYLMG